MIRFSRLIKVFLVAGQTLLRCSGVTPSDVAFETGHRKMRTGKRKFAQVVIEARIEPICCGVALLAGLWEVASCVVGVLRAGEIREVTCHAGFRSTGVT